MDKSVESQLCWMQSQCIWQISDPPQSLFFHTNQRQQEIGILCDQQPPTNKRKKERKVLKGRRQIKYNALDVINNDIDHNDKYTRQS